MSNAKKKRHRDWLRAERSAGRRPPTSPGINPKDLQIILNAKNTHDAALNLGIPERILIYRLRTAGIFDEIRITWERREKARRAEAMIRIARELAKELNRTPTYHDYGALGYNPDGIVQVFGTVRAWQETAGLKPNLNPVRARER